MSSNEDISRLYLQNSFANIIAPMRFHELLESLISQIASPVLFLDRVYLRIRVSCSNTLDIANHLLTIGDFIGEVCEGLGDLRFEAVIV